MGWPYTRSNLVLVSQYHRYLGTVYCIYRLPVIPKPPTPSGSSVEDHGAPWRGVVHPQPEVILALLAT